MSFTFNAPNLSNSSAINPVKNNGAQGFCFGSTTPANPASTTATTTTAGPGGSFSFGGSITNTATNPITPTSSTLSGFQFSSSISSTNNPPEKSNITNSTGFTFGNTATSVVGSGMTTHTSVKPTPTTNITASRFSFEEKTSSPIATNYSTTNPGAINPFSFGGITVNNTENNRYNHGTPTTFSFGEKSGATSVQSNNINIPCATSSLSFGGAPANTTANPTNTNNSVKTNSFSFGRTPGGKVDNTNVKDTPGKKKSFSFIGNPGTNGITTPSQSSGFSFQCTPATSTVQQAGVIPTKQINNIDEVYPITGSTPYTNLPNNTKESIDTLVSMIHHHQRIMYEIDSMSPALLTPSDISHTVTENYTKSSFFPILSSSIDDDLTPLPVQIQSLHHHLTCLEKDFMELSCDAKCLYMSSQRLHYYHERSAIWPIEELAERWNVKLKPLPRRKGGLERTQLLGGVNTNVDRRCLMPSPFAWEIVANLECRNQAIYKACERIKKELDILTMSNPTFIGNFTSTEQKQHIITAVKEHSKAFVRIAGKIGLFHEKIQKLKTDYRNVYQNEQERKGISMSEDPFQMAERKELDEKCKLQEQIKQLMVSTAVTSKDYTFQQQKQSQALIPNGLAPAANNGVFESTPSSITAISPGYQPSLFSMPTTPTPAIMASIGQPQSLFGVPTTPGPSTTAVQGQTQSLFGVPTTPGPSTTAVQGQPQSLFGIPATPAPPNANLFGAAPFSTPSTRSKSRRKGRR